jgi:hypothetical protein
MNKSALPLFFSTDPVQ